MRLKRFFQKSKNNKRGFTIVEAVIAMAVIAIVSAAATSTVRRTFATTGQDFEYEHARIYMENALEAFKYSEDLAEFRDLLQIDGIRSEGSIYDESNMLRRSCSFTSNGTSYQLYISVAYPEDGRPTFIGTVQGKSKILISINYRKGE